MPIEQGLANLRAETRLWMAEYLDQPARGSLLKVLKQAIEQMEKAEFSIKAAHMVQDGAWPRE